MKDKIIYILLTVLLIIQVCFLYFWINILDRNQKQLIDQLHYYQELSYTTDAAQNKNIRLLQQDVLILQDGYKDAE